MAYHPVDSPYSLEIILDQVSEADGVIEILLPALDAPIHADGNVALLADGAAKAPRLAAGGEVGEGVCQIVEFTPVEDFGGHVVLEPQYFRDLHLHAHRPTYIAQKVVLGGVDLLRLRKRPVIKPQDHVAVVAVIGKVRRRHWNGLVRVVAEDGEGASCVESEPLYGSDVDLRLGNDLLDAETNRVPYISGGLLLVVGISASRATVN